MSRLAAGLFPTPNRELQVLELLMELPVASDRLPVAQTIELNFQPELERILDFNLNH